MCDSREFEHVVDVTVFSQGSCLEKCILDGPPFTGPGDLVREMTSAFLLGNAKWLRGWCVVCACLPPLSL